MATATQRELAAQGRVSSPESHNKDSMWSEGLVGAARMVAAATSTLCEAANAAVQVRSVNKSDLKIQFQCLISKF